MRFASQSKPSAEIPVGRSGLRLSQLALDPSDRALILAFSSRDHLEISHRHHHAPLPRTPTTPPPIRASCSRGSDWAGYEVLSAVFTDEPHQRLAVDRFGLGKDHHLDPHLLPPSRLRQLVLQIPIQEDILLGNFFGVAAYLRRRAHSDHLTIKYSQGR